MRTISRRLRRLEDSFAPKENEEVRSLVVLLRERRRRRLEAISTTIRVTMVLFSPCVNSDNLALEA